MKRAFTLIEIMVATMLLAMLVTILTMIFNQSSIAWSTGVASVTALGDTRQQMSVCARESENVILSDAGDRVLGVTSVWDFWDGNNWTKPQSGQAVMKREAFRTLKGEDAFEQFFRNQNVASGDVKDPLVDKIVDITGGGSAKRDSYLVGVHSYGPDGKTGADNSWDDISTMPEEIVQ